MRDAMAHFLSSVGYQVAAPTDGESPEAAVAKSKPDAVLLHADASGAEGLAETEAIRKRSDVPVILMVDEKSVSDAFLDKAREARANHLLGIPMTPQGLLSAVNAYAPLHREGPFAALIHSIRDRVVAMGNRLLRRFDRVEDAVDGSGDHERRDDPAAPARDGGEAEKPAPEQKHLTAEELHKVRSEIAKLRFWKGQKAEAQFYREQLEKIAEARTLQEAAAIAVKAVGARGPYKEAGLRCRENLDYRWALEQVASRQYIDSAGKARDWARDSLALRGADSVAFTGRAPERAAGTPVAIHRPAPAQPAVAKPAADAHMKTGKPVRARSRAEWDQVAATRKAAQAAKPQQPKTLNS